MIHQIAPRKRISNLRGNMQRELTNDIMTEEIRTERIEGERQEKSYSRIACPNICDSH